MIEVSDDEGRQLLAMRAQAPRPTHRAVNKEIIMIDSSSDGGDSEMDVIVMPTCLTHKRSRTDANLGGGSPHTSARARGKRRATPAEPHGVGDAASLQTSLGHPFKDQAAQTTFFTGPNTDLRSRNKVKATKKREAEEAPYYVDGRLDVKMYRGPGYARFPIALGTVEGHQELCDKWDAGEEARSAKHLAKLERQAHKTLHQHTAYTIPDSDNESDSDDDSRTEQETAFAEKCLQSVVEIFPDIDRAFVQKKISEAPPHLRSSKDDDELVTLGLSPLAENLISEILEMKPYPKGRASASSGAREVAADDGTGITIAWDRSRPKDAMYVKDGVILIAKHFPHIPTIFIDETVKETKSIFLTYITLHSMEEQFFETQIKPYPRRKQARIELEKKYALKATDRRVPADYANRVNELQFARQHVEREAIKDKARKAKDETEALNLAEHVKSGAIIECQCCFDGEIPLNRMVPCMAEFPHNFCFTCVEGLADTQVGMLKHEMLCMDGSGCTAKLSHDDVGRAIPITTFNRLDLNKQQAEIMAANIEGLEQCPECDYKAICGDVEEEPIFYCQNPDCSRATCRKCQKDDHSPKTCKEASVDKNLSARHLIEEARSEAIIRTCRKCKAKIVKEFGCNKMTCTRCGSFFCYNCNEDITKLGGNAYSHFGRDCILYDVTQGGDRHEKEANEAEKEAISKAKAMDAELDETKLQIDTGKVDPQTPAMHNLLNHPAGGVFMQDINNRAARLNNHQARMVNMQARIDQLAALWPDRDIADLVADVRAMNGAFDVNNVPAPEVRMQQMQQLYDMQRRTQANLAQHLPRQVDAPPPMPPMPPMPRRPARRSREVVRQPPVDPTPAVSRNQVPNQGPDPFFQPQNHHGYNDPAGFSPRLGAGYGTVPDFDWAGPQAAPPRLARPFQGGAAGGREANLRSPFQEDARGGREANLAQAQGAGQRYAEGLEAAIYARRDVDRARAAAAARTQAAAAHRQVAEAGQLIQETFARAQEQLAAVGFNINLNGNPFPMAQYQDYQANTFPPNDAPGGRSGGRRYP